MKLINTAVDDEFIINELLGVYAAEQRLASVLAMAGKGLPDLTSDRVRAEVVSLNARLDNLERSLNALESPCLENAIAA